LRKVDLAVELQILSFYQQRRAGLTVPDPDGTVSSSSSSALAGPPKASA
jgi:hypothetical protein